MNDTKAYRAYIKHLQSAQQHIIKARQIIIHSNEPVAKRLMDINHALQLYSYAE